MYNDAYWIVMRRYRCSLAEWRTRQRAGPDNAAAARLYLTILAQVRSCLQACLHAGWLAGLLTGLLVTSCSQMCTLFDAPSTQLDLYMCSCSPIATYRSLRSRLALVYPGHGALLIRQ